MRLCVSNLDFAKITADQVLSSRMKFDVDPGHYLHILLVLKKKNLMKYVYNSLQKICHDTISYGVRSMKEISSTASLITENSFRNELRFIRHFNEADEDHDFR